LLAEGRARLVFALDQFRPATCDEGLLTPERMILSMADEQHRQHASRTVPSCTTQRISRGHVTASPSREGDVGRLLLSGRQSRFTAFART
jgi:hypothetical protein